MCSSVRPASAGLPRPLDDLVAVHHVGPVFAQIGPERAEVARVDADVGRVDVRVDVVIREVAVVPLAHQVGHRAQREQVVRRLERQAVLEAQPLAGLDFLANRSQGVCCSRHHELVLSHREGEGRRNWSRASSQSDGPPEAKSAGRVGLPIGGGLHGRSTVGIAHLHAARRDNDLIASFSDFSRD